MREPNSKTPVLPGVWIVEHVLYVIALLRTLNSENPRVGVVKTVHFGKRSFRLGDTTIFVIFFDFRGQRRKIHCFREQTRNQNVFRFSSKPPVFGRKQKHHFPKRPFRQPRKRLERGCGCSKLLAGRVFWRGISAVLANSSPIFWQHGMLSLPRFGHFPARKAAAGTSAPPSRTLLDFSAVNKRGPGIQRGPQESSRNFISESGRISSADFPIRLLWKVSRDAAWGCHPTPYLAQDSKGTSAKGRLPSDLLSTSPLVLLFYRPWPTLRTVYSCI